MQLDRITLTGTLQAILAIATVAVVIAQHPFPSFAYANPADHLISVNGDVGPPDSSFLWSYRSMDLIAQAFVIFAASAGCLAVLRIGEREEE